MIALGNTGYAVMISVATRNTHIVSHNKAMRFIYGNYSAMNYDGTCWAA